MKGWSIRRIPSRRGVVGLVEVVAISGSRVIRREMTEKDAEAFDAEAHWQRMLRESRSAAAQSIRERSK